MTDPGNIVIFLLYFALSAGLLVVFLTIYVGLTRIHEWQLIRAGNTAVSIALGGAMIGFALPLASAIVHSQALLDAAAAAAIALAVQLSCFAAIRTLRRDAIPALVRGEIAEGVFLASTSIVLGILCAASLS